MQKKPTQVQNIIQTPKVEGKRFFISTNKKRNCVTSQGEQPLWRLSASVMTRDQSPAFKIPRASRFSQIQKDQINNIRFLDIELRKPLDKGISFARSTRKDHFLSKDKMDYPASTTYFESSKKLQLSLLNPEIDQKFSLINSHLNYLSLNKKGQTFNKFNKDQKLYLHHGRQMNYQPGVTKCNPGVGKYSLTPDKTKQRSPSFTIRKKLKQPINYHPGPGAYNIINFKSHKSYQINSKSTFQNSNRIFLQKPDNNVPGPGKYFVDI